MKSGKQALAKGGRVEPKEPKPKEDERTEEMGREEKKGRKFGGAVPGRALGGRLDRRARGGRMTPSSPLSGADVKKMPYETTHSGDDMGGKRVSRP